MMVGTDLYNSFTVVEIRVRNWSVVFENRRLLIGVPLKIYSGKWPMAILALVLAYP